MRLHELIARVRRQEDGFGLVELAVAIGVMFSAMLALLHVVGSGFTDIGFARQRQAANALASQLVEEARGVAYAEIEKGIDTANLNASGSEENCGGGVWKYKSCTATPSATNPAGEVIVHQTRPTVAPLDPHRIDDVTIESTALDRAVYVTRATSPNDGYRLIVEVTWDPVRSGPQPRVETHTLIFSPDGCRSTITHPFAAPCQPFLYGTADATSGSITATGTSSGAALPTAAITTPAARADVQDEQIARVLAQSTASTLALGDLTAGGLSTSTTADTDVATSAPGAYEVGSLTPETTEIAPASGYTLTYTGGDGDTPTAVSAAAASGSNACPTAPSPPAAETDLRPCARGRIAQTKTLSLDFDPAGSLGPVLLGSVQPAPAPAAGFVDRDPDATPTNAGRISAAAERSLGTVTIGSLPSGVTPPVGWAGYLVRLTGYSDSATAEAGTGSAAPAGAITAGTIEYWAGTSYLTMAVPTTASPVPIAPVVATAAAGGDPVELTITGTMIAGGVIPEQQFEGTSTTTRTIGKVSIAPPLIGTLDYVVTSGGSPTVINEDEIEVVRRDCGTAPTCIADLDVTVNLGTLLANAIYQAAPVA
jgi:hypothetical protein